MKKRIFCLALALLMLVGMLPVSSFAEGFTPEPPECDQGCNQTSVSAHQDQCAVKEYYRGIYLNYSAQELYDMKDILGEDAWAFIVSASWSLDNAKAQELNTLIQNGGPTTPENPCKCCENCTGAEDCECGCENCQFCEPEEPENPCKCCENCTGAEDCQCGCENCQFCEPEEPEGPTLTDPETNVAVTLETLPEGVDLEVDPDADVSAQFSDFGIPAAKQVFGLDITLTQGGAEYQPGGAYIKVPVNETIPVGTMIGIIHKHGNEVATFTGLTKVLSDHTVEFYTDSFSEFAGFTVDFHYEGVDYSIAGKTSIKLSELFTAMRITEDASQATAVAFSDPSLVEVTDLGGDWLLTSLDSFKTEETLVITFPDHTIVIDVTDPPWEETPFDFPNSATTGIEGHTKDNMTYNKTITVNLYNGDTDNLLDTATNEDVHGDFYLQLNSKYNRYWFYIDEITGNASQLRSNPYKHILSNLEQDTVTLSQSRILSGWLTFKIRCYPTVITNESNSDYCYVSRISKLAAPGHTERRSLNIVVDRSTSSDTTETFSNLLFPDRNGDGNGHGDVEADRDITITGTAPGYTYISKSESGTTYTVTVRPNTYTVVFNGNGNTGGSMSNQSFEYDVAQNLRANGFTRAYEVSFDSQGGNAVGPLTATATFNGWATSSGGAVKYSNQQSVQKLTTTDGQQITLYANWTKGKVILPTLPDKTGYTFGGWSYNGKSYAAGEEFEPASDVEMVAIWNPKSYTVNWNNWDGSTIKTDTVTHGGSVTYSGTTPTKSVVGYTSSFTGWDKGTNGTISNVTANTTVTAQFSDTPITYKVSFDMNGATSTAIATQTYTWDTRYTLPTPTGKFVITYDHNYKVNASDTANKTTSENVNATFNGWEDQGSIVYEGVTYSYDGSEEARTRFDAPFYANPNKSSDVFAADWCGNGHYNKYGLLTHFVTCGIKEYYTDGKEVRKPAPTGSEGPGLYPGGAEVSNLSSTAGYTVPLVANWTAANSITLPNITRTGYTLTGWVIGGTTYDVGATYTPTANVTAVAQWEEAAAYKVTYEYDGYVPTGAPDVPQQADVKVGDSVTVEGAPTPAPTGYNFNGWTTADVAVTNGKFTMPNKPVTFTGSWTLIDYTIEYELNGGENNRRNPKSYNVESSDITLEDPTPPDGYTFGGWTGTDLTQATQTVTIPTGSTGNRFYTANWTPKTYTITYNHNDKDTNPAISTVYYDIEDDLTLNDAPTREGYKFSKWNLAAGLTAPNGNWEAGDYDASQQIAKGKYGDIELVAQWTDQYRYVLKFDANGGENAPATLTQEWKDENSHQFTWTTNPTREGYDFMGWATESDGEPMASKTSYTMTGKPHDTEEVTLYAVWKRQTGDLELTFDGDNTKPAIVTVTGQGKSITVVLTKEKTVIKDLPTGEYTVTAESGRATYTASVDNSNPTVVKGDTVTVAVTIRGGNSNWFTAFFRVKNKYE